MTPWLRRAATAAALPLLLVAPGCDAVEDILDELDLPALEARFDCDVRSISSSASGTLSPADCEQVDDGSYIDYYAFRVTEPTTVDLLMQSNDFDAYLLLYDEQRTLVDQDDDSGGELDAAISRTLQPGIYVIGANSASPDETGSYALTLEL